MPRLKITVAYEGTKFVGWQLQKNGRTVQGVLEEAVARIVGEPVRVHGSGRTDSGVHARGQVAHFDIPEHRLDVPWGRALNSILPGDVAVTLVERVHDDFHARYHSLSKTYSYTLWVEPTFLDPMRRRHVWACGSVDVRAMELAASMLKGTHDFTSFQNAGTDIKTTVRTITDFRVEQGQTGYELVWLVSADGFLKQMVRNLMGLLVTVGRGKADPEIVRSLLDERDRTLAPGTAPAQGLCLERVVYPEHVQQGAGGDGHQMGTSSIRASSKRASSKRG